MDGPVNHMDSIARPTSKVIQPPGGSSSGIFGGETYQPKRHAEGNRKNESSIFGSPREETPKPKTPPKTTEEVCKSTRLRGLVTETGHFRWLLLHFWNSLLCVFKKMFSFFLGNWSSYSKTHFDQSRCPTGWQILHLLRLTPRNSLMSSPVWPNRESSCTWLTVIEKNKFVRKYFPYSNFRAAQLFRNVVICWN